MDLKPKTLLRRVFDFARSEIERRSRPPEADETEEGSHEAPLYPGARPPRSSRPPHERPSPVVLDVSRDPDGVLRAQWAIDSADVARSERLAGENAILCLRLVSFECGRDDVKREVLDRPFVDLSGACDLGTAEVRGVLAIGLRAGDRFVSIAHHIV
jgi:hypothetical protein